MYSRLAGGECMQYTEAGSLREQTGSLAGSRAIA